jgi:nucleoid-associated protein YgaU
VSAPPPGAYASGKAPLDAAEPVAADSAPVIANGPESRRAASEGDPATGRAQNPDPSAASAEAPQPDGAPDPLLPAPALGDVPAQGPAPAPGPDSARLPAAGEIPPQQALSAPLTLAQVLPPGVAPAPDQTAPSFDLVRVAPDGSTVIAGRAAPGAEVQVFSGQVPVAEATASARGEFVVFLDPPDPVAPEPQIPAAPEGASLVVSQDDVIILPAAPDAEEAAPMVLHRTPDAVQVIQPSGPAIPQTVSLDLVSYSAEGAVQLAGRGQPGDVARIYTDNTLVGEARIATGGNWKLEISGIAEGRYMLRVDEIAPDGSVVSRTESPFQRQFPAADTPDTFTQGAKIIVQPGNTLWLMATQAYGHGDAYVQIFSANRAAISDPDLIYPGQIFTIPRVEE